ncbi:MAG TPA: phage tail tape measure protein [Propionicimonas sp.]|jgi:TP901 family phage tail tape measure protein
MTERTVSVKLKADVAQFKTAMADAGQSTEKTTKKAAEQVAKQQQAVKDLTTGAMAAGAAMAATAALAVKKFADFDQAMSHVQAATMETTQNMGLLRSAALQAGADTMYTASEAAAAIEDMAKAGVQTTDILKGGLTGSLNLAAAAQMGVADAAEATATAMNQFGLKGADATHIADLLAASAGKAMGDVSDMAGALKFVGPVAHQMGVSIEETAGAIAMLAQQGILGEQAGTSLRGMIMALTSPSKIAAGEIDALGIKVYNAQGNFVGLAGVAQQLQDKMAGLTNAERDQAFGRIFGNEQVTTARVLYAAGAAGVEKWTAAVNDSGYAAEQARIKTDNLKGDVERLGGSLDTVFIKGGSGANGSLREMVQSVEAVVNAIGEIPGPVLGATTMIAGAGGLAVLAVGGLGKVTVAVNEVRTAMAAMNISMKTAGIATGVLGAAVTIGTVLFAKWADGQAKAKQATDDFKATLNQTTGAFTASTREAVSNKLETDGIIAKYTTLGGVASDLTDAVLGQKDALSRVNGVLGEHTVLMQDVAGHQWTRLSDESQAVAASVGDMSGQLSNASESTKRQADAAGEAARAEQQQASGANDSRTALEKLAAEVRSGTNSTQNMTQAIKDLIDAQSTLAGNAISEAQAQIQFQQALDDATASVKENGHSFDINTEQGRANKGALLDIASAAWDVITSMQANNATQGALQTTMETSRQSFINTATAMGMSKDKATALADQLNLIPENVSVAVAVNTENAQKAIDNFIGMNGSRSILLDVGGTVARVGQYVARARGGAIASPPTTTSALLFDLCPKGLPL